MKYSLARMYRFSLSIVWVLMLGFMLISADSAWAVTCNGTNGPAPCFTSAGLPGTCENGSADCVENPDPDGTCTSDEAYDQSNLVGGEVGMVQKIITQVTNTLNPLMSALFNGIAGNTGFQQAASAAVLLYVILYGASFMLGMVQITIFDFMIRMVKITIVSELVLGTAAQDFSKTFVHFFNDGTSDIIAQSAKIITPNGQVGGGPFGWIDSTILELVSVKMEVTLMAAGSTGPFCLVIISILTMSLYNFVKAMLYALWIYIMTLTMRTLLFGLAPLFLSCILFTRTRHLFDGWLNQVVNSCLQPIFLFIFFSFFVQLIKSQFDLLTGLNVCWTEQALFTGAPNAAHYWRFAVWSCIKEMWVPFDGQWDFSGPVNTGCPGQPVNPIGLMLPITLWILTDLAKRFNGILVAIAQEIANATTSFDYRGKPGFGQNIMGSSSGKSSGPPGPDGKQPPDAPPAPIPPRAGPPALTQHERRAESHKPNQGRPIEEVRARMEEMARRRDKTPLASLPPPPTSSPLRPRKPKK